MARCSQHSLPLANNLYLTTEADSHNTSLFIFFSFTKEKKKQRIGEALNGCQGQGLSLPLSFLFSFFQYISSIYLYIPHYLPLSLSLSSLLNVLLMYLLNRNSKALCAFVYVHAHLFLSACFSVGLKTPIVG